MTQKGLRVYAWACAHVRHAMVPALGAAVVPQALATVRMEAVPRAHSLHVGRTQVMMPGAWGGRCSGCRQQASAGERLAALSPGPHVRTCAANDDLCYGSAPHSHGKTALKKLGQ